MAKKNKIPKWATTVTPFSKFLALSMLVIFPILGFFFGRYYENTVQQQPQKQQKQTDCVTYCNPKPTKLVVKQHGDKVSNLAYLPITITDTTVVQKLYKELESFKVLPPNTRMGCPEMRANYQPLKYDLTFYKDTEVLRHVIFSPSGCRVSITLDDNTVEYGITVESLDFAQTFQQALKY